MNRPTNKVISGSVSRSSEPGGFPRREFQELWFALSSFPWASVVLVPADEGGTTADVATALAEIGSQLRGATVRSLVVEEPLDPAKAAAMAQDVATTARARGTKDEGQLIVAIRPVVTEPLGAAIAQAADAVILCVEEGRSRLESAERSIEIIGRERIAGSFLIRGATS